MSSCAKYLTLPENYILATGTTDRCKSDPLHEHTTWDAWEKWVSLRYKDLMYEMLPRRGEKWHRGIVFKGMVARGSASTPMGLGHSLSSKRKWARHLYNRVVHPTSSAKGIAKYQELKVNAKHLHIKNGSPIPTDEQLMFEAVGGSNKCHRQRSSSMLSVSSISSAAAHDACIEREKRLWGYMQQPLDNFAAFMTSFASQFGVQMDLVPTLFSPFPPTDDLDVPQPPTGTPSSSSPPPPM
ncbi:hypothetical protein M9H77_26776 [Catharanthus roseus]|uniref:Uncharacterized protein n=1 Tax=Catharanthus roseus TaxID=4058 RepID=A0ACC0AEW2_CATRO|nr:hypothetical protein M9H77_26776 [Catharanthus roseus]